MDVAKPFYIFIAFSFEIETRRGHDGFFTTERENLGELNSYIVSIDIRELIFNALIVKVK